MDILFLDKERKLKTILKRSATIDLREACKTLGALLNSGCIFVNNDGVVIGDTDFVIDSAISDRLQDVLSTKENTDLNTIGIDYNGMAVIIPVMTNDKRFGSVIVYRTGSSYNNEEITMIEHIATVFTVYMANVFKNDEKDDKMKETAVNAAVSSLSLSETIAVSKILEILDYTDGIIIVSRIADEAAITRSIVVNALRKLESGGVIETKSYGRSGTHIAILNDKIIDAMRSDGGDKDAAV